MPNDLWEQIQSFTDESAMPFKDTAGLAVLPADVAAAPNPGAGELAAANHVHRGVGAIEVEDTYLRGNVELARSTNIDIVASETARTVTFSLEDDIVVDSVTAQDLVVEDLYVDGVLRVDDIRPAHDSPDENIEVSTGLTLGGVLRVDEIRPASDSPSGDVLVTGNAAVSGDLAVGDDLTVDGGGYVTEDLTVDGVLRVDEIRPESDSPTGTLLVTGDVDIQGELSLSSFTGDIVTTTNVGTSIEELDESQYVEGNTGFLEWTSGADASTYTVDGTGFQINRAGTGYIDGRRIDWVADQKTAALAANDTSWIYIDSTGTIGAATTWSDPLFHDYIVLFECLYDGTNYITVRENHPVDFQAKISTEWHELIGVNLKARPSGVVGATIGRVATGTGAAAGDREIKLSGEALLCDHGIETTIPDSAGAGVTWNWYFTNAAGKWNRHAAQTQAPMYYNSAGTATALDSGKYGVYRLYVSKDDIESALPKYFAVMNTAQYNNAAQARAAVTAGVPRATNELYDVELAQLGYIIVLNNVSGGYVFEVDVDKQVLSGTTTGAGAEALAALISVVTSEYDGAPTEILSTSDSNVQNALNTINDFLKTAHEASGDWVFNDSLYVGDILYADGGLYTDVIAPSSQSPTGVLNVDGTDITSTQWGYLGAMDQDVSTSADVEFNSIITAGMTIGGDFSITGKLYVDTIYPYSASPDVDIRIDHNLDVSGTVRAEGNLYAPNVNVYAQWYSSLSGNATSGAWRKRLLPGELTDPYNITTSDGAGGINLGPGTYYISARSAFYRCAACSVLMYDETTSTVICSGRSYFANTTDGSAWARTSGRYVSAKAFTMYMYYQVQTTRNTDGLGVGGVAGVDTYAIVEIWKVA